MFIVVTMTTKCHGYNYKHTVFTDSSALNIHRHIEVINVMSYQTELKLDYFINVRCLLLLWLHNDNFVKIIKILTWTIAQKCCFHLGIKRHSLLLRHHTFPRLLL